jgi:hypothetical protein
MEFPIVTPHLQSAKDGKAIRREICQLAQTPGKKRSEHAILASGIVV